MVKQRFFAYELAVVILAIGQFCQAASFQGVGDLPDGVFSSFAEAVSADGLVVVGSGRDTNSTQKAFRWTASGGMSELGDLSGGGFSSVARGVSADGDVVVGNGTSGNGTEAFRWTSGGGMVGLGDLAGGWFASSATCVSGNGSVVAGWSDGASNHSVIDWEAFRWTSGGMVSFGGLTGTTFYSIATGISADGSIAAGYGYGPEMTNPLLEEACVWTTSGLVPIGFQVGGSKSFAHAISADGTTVVGSGSSTQSTQQAFRWTSGGGMVSLGDLSGGVFSSKAYGVSADGAVVVGVGSSASGQEAFVWNSVDGMQSIKDILTIEYGLDLTGWTLDEAKGVSNDGLTVVGYGTNPDGFREGWIATLVENPVSFSDVVLQSAIETSLGITDPTCTDMEGLISLDVSNSGVTDLSGMECAVNIETLNLSGNDISDISPLANLTNLQSSSPLVGSKSLSGGIASLSNLQTLDLSGNPLNAPAYCRYIPEIQANNSGVSVLFDADPNPLSADCSISLAEFEVFVLRWLESPCDVGNNWCGGTDLLHSGMVEMENFSELGFYWP